MSGAEVFNTECMLFIIENLDWGKTIADGSQFYKGLFKLDKKENITADDVKVMFASYKNWKKKVGNMLEECKNETREDREAITWAHKTDEDIVQHMHVIITEKKCNEGDLVNELVTKYTSVKQQQQAISQQATAQQPVQTQMQPKQ